MKQYMFGLCGSGGKRRGGGAPNDELYYLHQRPYTSLTAGGKMSVTNQSQVDLNQLTVVCLFAPRVASTCRLRDGSSITGRGGGEDYKREVVFLHLRKGGGGGKFVMLKREGGTTILGLVLTLELEVLAILKGGGGAKGFTLS